MVRKERVLELLATRTISVTELRKSARELIEDQEAMPVAVRNRNRVVAYIVSAEMFEEMTERLEDAELNAIADARKDGPFFTVNMEDLLDGKDIPDPDSNEAGRG